MKKVIERPQISDMGSGFGSYQFSKNYTLREFPQPVSELKSEPARA